MPTRFLVQSFEQLVRAQMSRRGIALVELARRMETSSQAVISILTQNNPKMTTVQRVARALGCDPRELVP